MMQLTCGRCGTQWTVVGSTAPPCPRCGSMVAPAAIQGAMPGAMPARSPMAATTERTALGGPDTSAASSAHTLPAPTPAMLAPPQPSSYGAAPAATPSYPPPNPTYPSQAPALAAPSYAAPPGPPYGTGGPPFGAGAPPYGTGAPATGPHAVHPSYPGPAPVHVVIHGAAPIVPAPAYAAPPPAALAPYGRRRDSGIAALLSFFLPGAGQLYNGQTGKGVGFLLVTVFVNVPLMFLWIGFATQLVTWLWAMIDAYVSAEKINRGAA